MVSGAVGIDGIAGPSEVMVVADGTANPEWIALDVCAQGEHGDDGSLIVASPDLALLERIGELVDELVAERPSVADAPLALVSTTGVEAALTLADAVAPEHLELVFDGSTRRPPGRASPAACSSVGWGRPLSATTRRGRTTCFPPGERRASRDRSGRLPSGAASRWSRCRVPRPLPWRRRWTCSQAPRAFLCTASRFVHGPGADRRRSLFAGDFTNDMSRTAEIRRKTRETQITLALELDGGEVPARPGSGSWITCSSCSAIMAGSACGSRRRVTSTRAPTTPSRTSGSRSGRRSTGRWGTGPASAATGTWWCRWTRLSGSARSTSPGRPLCRFESDLPPTSIAGFDAELAEEFFRAVATSAKLTLHVGTRYGSNAHHMIEACFKAFARALREAVSIDPDRPGRFRPRRGP